MKGIGVDLLDNAESQNVSHMGGCMLSLGDLILSGKCAPQLDSPFLSKVTVATIGTLGSSFFTSLFCV